MSNTLSSAESAPSWIHRLLAGLVVLGTLLVGLVAAPGPASAATARNGICESGEFCYSYNSDWWGSVSDFNVSVPNYGTDPNTCYEFKTKHLNGYGQCVKNNAASVWNNSNRPVKVYLNSGFKGAYQVVLPGKRFTLTTLKNNNASHQFYIPGATP